MEQKTQENYYHFSNWRLFVMAQNINKNNCHIPVTDDNAVGCFCEIQ